MPVVLAIALPLLMVAILMVLLNHTVTARWQFEHRGRSIDVIRYATRVVLTVDGQAVAGTEVAKTSMHTREHAVRVDGRLLRVRLELIGQAAYVCRAWESGQLVFDSREAPLGPLTTADIPAVGTAPLPWGAESTGPPRLPAASQQAHVPATPRPASASGDSRRAATRELLDDLARASDPEVVARAHGLNERIASLLSRIEQVRHRADLHATLGGSAETDRLLQELEGKLEPALRELRALHLALLSGPPSRPELTTVAPLPLETRGAASRSREAAPSPRVLPTRRWDAG